MEPTLADYFRYFLWLGATGFGGPIALCGALVYAKKVPEPVLIGIAALFGVGWSAWGR